MNPPKRSPPTGEPAVKTPVAGVTSVPAPKRDGDHGAVNPGHSMSSTVDRDQQANPASVTGPSSAAHELAEELVDDARMRLRDLGIVPEPKRLPMTRSLAGVPMKDASRRGPPPGTYLPKAKAAGRKGASRSPWRQGLAIKKPKAGRKPHRDQE